MRVFRIVRVGQSVLSGPWASHFVGQTADNLYSVVHGKGNLIYWLSEAFSGNNSKHKGKLDIIELGINEKIVKGYGYKGELLITKDDLLRAKIISRKTFYAKNIRRESETHYMAKYINNTDEFIRYGRSLGRTKYGSNIPDPFKFKKMKDN